MKSMVKWISLALLISASFITAYRIGHVDPSRQSLGADHEAISEYNVFLFNLPQVTKKEPFFQHPDFRSPLSQQSPADEFIGRGPLMPLQHPIY